MKLLNKKSLHLFLLIVCTLFSIGCSMEAKGENAKDFLQEKLSLMGLIPKEYNEFIVYWLPEMQNNKYNLIKFAEEEYEKIAPLEITPKPDSVQRVFMVFKELNKAIDVEEQELKPFKREGFTVIEWGGTEIK